MKKSLNWRGREIRIVPNMMLPGDVNAYLWNIKSIQSAPCAIKKGSAVCHTSRLEYWKVLNICILSQIFPKFCLCVCSIQLINKKKFSKS